MSHYAEITDGIVTRVIVADEEVIKTYPGEWVQTSYNTRYNKHALGGTPLRGNYAGIGYIYDRENDVFYPPKHYESWSMNKESWRWEPPIAYPNDDKFYHWDECSLNWELD